ncbi:BEL1-like homeodomain protein 9 [Gastrolobium bilobum]|uniref:BEL1-like homeodomain protein 9 n=1 Tax=Gastrolobium bilobum TaxID=150636 RepID=UPI002AB1D9E0|nr:BEL1-like homeodomain protein 9 [Gastrolobium bilobum]
MVIHESQGPCSDLRNWVPIGPFTGYASILKRSRFLKPAQQLLEDLCGSVWDPPPMDSLSENDNDEDPITGISGDAIQHQWRDSKLACMLEEVYKKYALYSQHMQSVVESFQKVAGLGNATPYISFGMKTISKHFGCLKHAIYDQLQFTSKTTPAANNSGEKEIFKYSTFLSIPHPVQPILRSQRGLPDHAVALLKRWLFEHFLHPYPTDSEKDILAQQTGLSRCQVSNWFINARVRIWKPMVEEMHMLGEQQAQPLEVNHNVSMHVAGPFAPLHKPI